MEYIQENWRIQKWSKKPGEAARFEIIKTVYDYKEIQNFSFLKNEGLGWYTSTWFRQLPTGKWSPHHIESAYYKHQEKETGKIVIEHWRGRYGDWKKVVNKKYLS